MKKLRKQTIRKIGLLLSLALLLGSVPSLLAVGNDSGAAEREMLANLEYEEISEEELAELLKKSLIQLELVKQENKRQIEVSMKNLVPSQTRATYVALGTDEEFTSADTWDKGKYQVSFCIPTVIDSGYSGKTALATSYLGPGVGYGGAWAYAGKEFTVTGTGSQSVNIIVDGTYEGLTMGALSGSAETEISLHVYDVTDDVDYSEEIYAQVATLAQYFGVDEEFRNGVGLTLHAGNTYVVYVLVETSAVVASLGSASSDFGPYDADEGEVWYYSIEIDF